MIPFNETLWMIIIMINSTGYGDITPITPMGRLMSLLSCFSGVGIMSLLIVSLTNQSYL